MILLEFQALVKPWDIPLAEVLRLNPPINFLQDS